MKDITRVHIAKVTYSIELDTKEVLEKYIESLKAYAEDEELLNDIEIRITELLSEQGVKPDGVITDADVAAVRKQLGEPEEFISEGDMAIGDDVKLSTQKVRRLYRNLDNALVGGVMSGVASYLGINALWTRLVFIVLLFVSFGLVLVLYLLLWLILPPAQTAAEKLQMEGRPVTLSSIRELNEMQISKDIKARRALIKRITTLTLGILSILAALGTILATIIGWVSLTYTVDGVTRTYLPMINGFQTAYPPAVYLAAASLVLLILFFILSAYAAFSQKFNKRIWISGLVIIVLGLGSVGGAIGVTMYQYDEFNKEIARNTVETSIKLPTNFPSIKKLVIDTPTYVNVDYVVDQTNSIVLKSTKGLSVDVSVTDGIGTLRFPDTNSKIAAVGPNTTITVHGPQLDMLVGDSGYISYRVQQQEKLQVEGHRDSSIVIHNSIIDTLSVTLDNSSHLIADGSSVKTALVNQNGDTYSSLGNVKEFSLIAPEACAAESPTTVYIKSIKNTTYTYNTQQLPSHSSFKDACVKIEIGDDIFPTPETY